MLRLFYLASELGPTGAARQLARLAVGLPRDRFHIDVGVLGAADTPVADELRQAGVAVQAVPLRHVIDVRGTRRLREVATAAAPAVVHAFGPAAAAAAGWLTKCERDGGNRPRLIVSAAAESSGGLAGWRTTRRLRRADRVVPATWAEGQRYHGLGVPGERLTRIAPGVAPAGPPPLRDEFLRTLGLPAHARLVVACGRIEPSPGMKDAVWAFDLLRYEFTELQLLLFGTGPDRAGLEAFGRALAFDDFRVHFPGPRSDLAAILGLAEAVWVTRPRGGITLALEAMAAGRPVVGWRTPDLAEIVADGETGILVPTGDRAQVAARTHGLLADPNLAAKLGSAGQARAAEQFGAARMVDHFAKLYAEVVV